MPIHPRHKMATKCTNIHKDEAWAEIGLRTDVRRYKRINPRGLLYLRCVLQSGRGTVDACLDCYSGRVRVITGKYNAAGSQLGAAPWGRQRRLVVERHAGRHDVGFGHLARR
jgi:hypothetical protein